MIRYDYMLQMITNQVSLIFDASDTIEIPDDFWLRLHFRRAIR